jgi:UDP-N-acetylglucosamine pyrophosphorylase
MRFEPGFIKTLSEDLVKVNVEYTKRFRRFDGLDDQALINLVANQHNFNHFCEAEHPSQQDVVDYESMTPAHAILGEKAVKNGEIAYVVLAGGSGTRFGKPKAFVTLPKLGISLVANKLMQSIIVDHNNEILNIPIFFMTQPDLVKQFVEHLSYMSPPPQCTIFEQFESYRLLPDNSIDFISPGVPNMHPCGHGDVGPALLESEVLSDNPQIKHVIIVNVDNVLAAPDMAILGQHLSLKSDVTCEVVKSTKQDKGGRLAYVDGKLQIVEDFRLDPKFVKESKYCNTNTMIMSTSALIYAAMNWKWHRVRKEVNNKIVIQYERLLQQYTEVFDTNYVLVPREKRYVPIKNEADLLIADKMLNGNR